MTRKQSGEKKTCLKCANSYAVSSFYSHRNSLINEQFGLCKKCVKENINLDNMDTLMDFLRTMDIPYLKEFWKISNEAKTETIGTYLKNMNSLRQNKELRFKDSDDIGGKTNKAELTEIENKEFEITDTVLKRWGRNLELEDYVFLEEEFENLGGLEAETTVQERIFKNMARTQWMANKALEENDTNKYEKMMKTLSTQMQDANIKPVQVKSASADGSIASWGEWVRKVEDTHPVEDGEPDYEPSYIKKYFGKFLVPQIKRVFGRASDEDIRNLNDEKL